MIKWWPGYGVFLLIATNSDLGRINKNIMINWYPGYGVFPLLAPNPSLQKNSLANYRVLYTNKQSYLICIVARP